MLPFTAQIARERAKLEQHDADPLREKVASITRGIEAISTNALLELIGLPNTTGNARRISKTMRALGYIPIKSRRLVPGGWNDTLCRGWARPLRDIRNTIPHRELSATSMPIKQWGLT
jgi:hypothetical protein